MNTQRTNTVIPMLCSDAPKGADGLPAFPHDPENWIMERKMDGWRFIAMRDEHSVVWVGGRNGKTYVSRSLDKVTSVLMRLPVGTVLDGELLAMSLDSTELKSPAVSTILANPRMGMLTYIVFDMLQLGDTNLRRAPLAIRKYALDRAVIKYDLAELGGILPHMGSEPDWHTYQTWLNEGSEGVVLKRKESPYVENVRSRDWIKLKPQLTCDAVIDGWKLGEGDHNRDLPGAFEITLESGAKTTVKIPDDATVASVARDDSKWIGRMIEIRHHGLFPNGKPRHPVMVRTREDREPVQHQTRSAAPRKSPPSVTTTGASRRNYGAMNLAKLTRCVDELESGSGQAYERCLAAGGDPAADLAVARAALNLHKAADHTYGLEQ